MSVGTVITAMITPFDNAGNVDLAEAARLARWLVDRGNDGLVVAGSTGEGMALDDGERHALVDAVKAAVAGHACVIANAGTNETRGSIAATQAAKKHGADAILAVVPYYNKPTPSGMLAHFGAIAESTDLPVVIYNVPGRTATNLLPETLLELARRHKNVVGVKESSGDLRAIATIARDRSPGFVLLCGDDHLFAPSLAVGADGIVGVASHLCSREFRQMLDAHREGDVATVTRLHLSLLGLFEALFATTSPIPIKWAMRQLGFAAGDCRLPLDAIPAALAQRLEPQLDRFRV
jgi:4-hydroxy-tetrahydrodipicolinate synthase